MSDSTNTDRPAPSPDNKLLGHYYIKDPDKCDLEPNELKVIEKARDFYDVTPLQIHYFIDMEHKLVAYLGSGSLQLLQSTEVPENQVEQALAELTRLVGTTTEALDIHRGLWVPVPVKSQEKKS